MKKHFIIRLKVDKFYQLHHDSNQRVINHATIVKGLLDLSSTRSYKIYSNHYSKITILLKKKFFSSIIL